ncbi:MAG: hypothetical protein RIS47_69 [Bacteroidota bacterium]|jgi:gliding motility-associated lipoprotein GldD
MKNKTFFLLVLAPIFVLSVVVACSDNNFTPRPRGYFRIDLPEKSYQRFDSAFPYSFDYPKYSEIQCSTTEEGKAYWVNIYFPKFNASIHFTYKFIDADIDKILEETYTLAYKHSVKADAIGESVYADTDKKVYGLLYDIQGNAASPKQFFLTDSTKHYLRGALYFSVHPNKDSLAPVVKFLNADIVRLIESLEWKKLPPL